MLARANALQQPKVSCGLGLHGCRHVANYKEKQRAVKSTLYYNRLPVRWPFAARSGHARPLGHCATHRRRSVDDAAPMPLRHVPAYEGCLSGPFPLTAPRTAAGLSTTQPRCLLGTFPLMRVASQARSRLLRQDRKSVV